MFGESTSSLYADEPLLLENGCIVERGNHAALCCLQQREETQPAE